MERNKNVMEKLVADITSGRRVLFVTGAGLSDASGIPPYRATPDALWNTHDVEWCRIAMFRKDPARWYTDFWRPVYDNVRMQEAQPNAGHLAIERLRARFSNVCIATQNLDRLHRLASATRCSRPVETSVERLVEAHGSIDRYRCVRSDCPYSSSLSFVAPVSAQPVPNVDTAKRESKTESKTAVPLSSSPPTTHACPGCGGDAMPLALLMDEEYNCHADFRWTTVQQWAKAAEAVVFVGTSLSVCLTAAVQKWATESKAHIYHFNLVERPVQLTIDLVQDVVDGKLDVDAACRLASENGPVYVVGRCEDTLPRLADLCLASTSTSAQT